MEKRPTQNRLQLLSQALSAAASSINLARQLINEIQREGGALEPPGLIGKYDGMFMVTEAGKKYPVPDNYAAKTGLVYGDKLKMIEGREGRRFKLIEKIPRVEAEATLTVKDGRFVAVSSEGSYKLIQSAVRYLGGEEGDKVKTVLPKEEKHAPFAAILEVIGKKKEGEKKVEKPEEEKEEKRAKAESAEAVGEGGKVPAKPRPKVEGPRQEPGKAAPKKEEKEKAKPAAKKGVVKSETKKTVTKAGVAKSTSGGKTPAKKGETKIEPPSEEELR